MSQTDLRDNNRLISVSSAGQMFRLKFRECPGGSGTIGASAPQTTQYTRNKSSSKMQHYYIYILTVGGDDLR